MTEGDRAEITAKGDVPKSLQPPPRPAPVGRILGDLAAIGGEAMRVIADAFRRRL